MLRNFLSNAYCFSCLKFYGLKYYAVRLSNARAFQVAAESSPLRFALHESNTTPCRSGTGRPEKVDDLSDIIWPLKSHVWFLLIPAVVDTL